MVTKFPLEASFLEGKSVLLTGSTGFVGKCILELILRDHYPYIKKVYCLIRGKKGVSLDDRLKEVMNNRIFNILKDRLGSRFTEVESKLVAVQGDIAFEGLGISPTDRLMLNREIQYVIHCAATVDFNERLDRSLTLNTIGTDQLLDLCDQCDNFIGFVHISTAYVNSNRKENQIYERVYPMVFGEPRELVDQIRNMDLDRIESFTKEVTAVYPNTYTFTKSLAENLVINRAEAMRVREIKTGRPAWSLAIVRPTVVTSTAVDPIPGWVDGVAAANAIAMYIGLGVLDSTPGQITNVLDLVPVDYLANMAIRACAEFKPPGVLFDLPFADQTRSVRTLKQNLGIDGDDSIYPRIYHAASSGLNPITWKKFGGDVVQAWQKLPPLKSNVFPPHFNKPADEVEHQTAVYLKQCQLRALSKMTKTSDPSKSIKIEKLAPKLEFLFHCFQHFMRNSWTFRADQVVKLEMQQVDRSDILCSTFTSSGLARMPWQNYINFFVYGMHYFVLNEDPTIRLPMLDGWDKVLHSSNTNMKIDMIEQGSLSQPINKNQINAIRDNFLNDAFVKSQLENNKVAEALKDVFEVERLMPTKSFDKESLWVKQQAPPIYCNRGKVLKLKDRLTSTSKVIYLPTHSSNLDFAVLCHTLNHYQLPLPALAVEGVDRILGYKLEANQLKSKSLFKKVTDTDLKRSLNLAYTFNLLKSTSVALFLDDRPDLASFGSLVSSPTPEPVKDYLAGNVPRDFNDLLEPLIHLLSNSDLNLSDYLLVPVSLSYDASLDLEHVVARKLGSDNYKVAPTLGSKGRIHLAFGNVVDLQSMLKQTELLKTLNLDDLTLTDPSYMFRSTQIQSTIVSPVSLVALILSGFRRIGGIRFEHARTLLSRLRSTVLNLGYNLDWGEEDSTAVLSFALEVIGKPTVHIKLDEVNNSKVKYIYLEVDPVNCLRLQAFIDPIKHVFAGRAMWLTAFLKVKNELADTTLPSLAQIESAFHLIQLVTGPHFPSTTVLKMEFSKLTQTFIKEEVIQIIDLDSSDAVIMNTDSVQQDLMQCESSLIQKVLDATWITSCLIETLPQLGPLQLPQLLSLIQTNLLQSFKFKISWYPEAIDQTTLTKVVTALTHIGLLNLQPSQSLVTVTHTQMDLSYLNRSLDLYCKPTPQPISFETCSRRLAIALEGFRIASLPRHPNLHPQLQPQIKTKLAVINEDSIPSDEPIQLSDSNVISFTQFFVQGLLDRLHEFNPNKESIEGIRSNLFDSKNLKVVDRKGRRGSLMINN